ncbi:AraC family transcriptional regulator [Desulfocurvus sp. DL9XJH121]
MNQEHDATALEELLLARRALAEKIARWTEGDPLLSTRVPGLLLMRYESPTEPASYTQEPGVCLVAQGAKRVLLADEEYVYDAHHYLITSVGLPVVANVVEASRETPLLGLVMRIDLRAVTRLLVDGALPQPRGARTGRGMAVSEISLPLVQAFNRLVDLLDEPADIPILAPLLEREILYRLLVGDQGARLRQIATAGSHGHQIARAVEWLKENYAQQFKVEGLAEQAGMSVSTFHHHFRALTSMSPLQFQKWLRLHEARRLMLTERLDAASASLQVGYESPSQFSREYKGLFGAPPVRDIKRLQQAM